jgi:predicted dehydrogenase
MKKINLHMLRRLFMSDKKVRVGIIGCGGIAGGKHLPALAQLKNVELVAFCDIVEERATKLAEQYGIEGAKVYTEYNKLLEDKSIEAVHVLTPNSSHAPISIAALEAGKHVLCEKPMAKTYAEGQAMLEAAKRTGNILTIGYQNRRSQEATYLKRVCENGDLGDMYYAKAHAIRRRGVPTWGVFLDEEKQGGGPLIDIGTHALDLTLWMLDNYDVDSVTGSVFKKLSNQTETANMFGEWNPEEFTVEDSAFGYIKLKNGAVVTLEASWALNIADPAEAQTTICGTKAGADMKDGVRINGVEYNKQYIKKTEFSVGGVAFFDGEGESSDPAVAEALTFYSAITNGTDLIVKPEQALVVTRVLEAIYESARTGKEIKF